jgi:Tol biopolymer transport system component
LYRLQWWRGITHVVRVTDNTQWNLSTGAWPSFSPANAWLMWQTLAADEIPGSVTPSSEIWVTKLDGNPPELVQKQAGGAAYWLDDDRLLLVTRVGQTNVFDLKLYTLSTNTTTSLLTVANLRGLTVAPGGRYVMYYAPFQDNRKESGVYLLERAPGRRPVLMPFFGSWRWRDSNSIIYIPYEPDKPMSFVLYDVVTGQSRRLTDPAAQPFEITNDDWSISPDGRYIVLWNEQDHALWLVTLTALI